MPSATAWHSLSGEEVLRRLGSGEGGLADPEAARRFREHGPNVFRVAEPASAWRILSAQLRSVIVALLAGAALIALLFGDHLDAAAIGVVLLLNVGIGFVTELRANRAMEALLGLEVTRARVVRDGRSREIDASELVPGDVIQLEAGQTVPADARLVDAVELRVVEASLTGESLPVDKRADAVLEADVPLPERVTMVYKTTTTVAGRARAVLVATGMATEVGRIGELAAAVVDEATPLERRLDALGRRLAGVAIAVAVLVALLGLRQGIPLGELLQTAIALAVAAVPEGLPVVGTIAMAVGVRRMARRRALIRHLPVVETLGSATVICTDKTGTLTAGEMTATVIRLDDREVAISGAGYAPEGGFSSGGAVLDPADDPRLALALRIGALANSADVVRSDNAWVPQGDPTEAALLVAARKAGLDRVRLVAEWPQMGELPFSSERMLMATFHRTGAGVLAMVKGAPERVVERSEWILTGKGPRILDQAGRDDLLRMNRELASRGLRVLALATGTGTGDGGDLTGLTWVGFVGLSDPPASGVQETIRTFREAGIRTVMITGDQRLTARSVARQLGLIGPGDRMLDGRELDRLSDDEMRDAVSQVAAYSRVSPEAKLRIVAAHQQQGQVVAMLGDGVNDAAALRKADIGVAMGRRGTDLAKEAADLVLEDDRFPTIGAAIEEGRVILDNIRKFVFYLFSCNLAEILVLLGAGIAGLPAPLLPLQILWLNLLTDTFPALALALEPPEPGIMQQPPRDPNAAILSSAMVRETLAYAALISCSALAAFVWGRAGGGDPGRATTLAFVTLALAQLFHLGNARSVLPVLTLHRMLANPHALVAVGLAVGLLVLAFHVPILSDVLHLHPLSGRDWLVISALGLVPGITGQTVKWLRARWR